MVSCYAMTLLHTNCSSCWHEGGATGGGGGGGGGGQVRLWPDQSYADLKYIYIYRYISFLNPKKVAVYVQCITT